MDTTHFQTTLREELNKLEKELSTLGRLDTENKVDWVPKADTTDIDTADRDSVADSLESLEENTAILNDLEIRYNEVKQALIRIEAGTFGICSVCKQPIESDRLAANPAATTCKKDMR